jgi:hypothetical protein
LFHHKDICANATGLSAIHFFPSCFFCDIELFPVSQADFTEMLVVLTNRDE